MSINIYARQAPIHDACGRADYISNSRRQENLMATASTFSRPDYWQILSADAQTAYRQAGGKRQNGEEETRACEAREIHLQLPNSALERMTADQLAKKIANDFKSKYGVECMVAIHYNKTKSNLHCHILFGERQLLQEPEIRIAERNIFIGADGIRKRTKKEIMDTDGNLLPGCSIVKKGEVLLVVIQDTRSSMTRNIWRWKICAFTDIPTAKFCGNWKKTTRTMRWSSR